MGLQSYIGFEPKSHPNNQGRWVGSNPSTQNPCKICKHAYTLNLCSL
jgi:hypothetical protein